MSIAITNTMARPLISILVGIFMSPIVLALEFMGNKTFNPVIQNGYVVQAGDTLGGYPLFAPENDWVVSYMQMASTTGTADSVKQPIVTMVRFENGKLVVGQTITVTVGTSNGTRWMGEPCSGEKTIKINFVRGGLDRCATANIQSIPIDGDPTEILNVNFIETNQGGRLYQATFYIHYVNLGFTRSEVTDKSSEFNKKLKVWMGTFLESVVKAAAYEKPANAFAGVPSLSKVFDKAP